MPNSHRPPDTTRQSCLWRGGVNWTIALNGFGDMQFAIDYNNGITYVMNVLSMRVGSGRQFRVTRRVGSGYLHNGSGPEKSDPWCSHHPSPPHSFIPGFKPSFSANPFRRFFFTTDTTDSPDCLPILLSISGFVFLS